MQELWAFLPPDCEFAFQFSSYFHRNDKDGNPFKFKTLQELQAYCKKHFPLSIHVRQSDYLIFDIDKDVEKICPFHPEEVRMVCDSCWVEEIRPQLVRLCDFLAFMGFEKVHVFDSGRRGVHVWAGTEEEIDKVGRMNIYNKLLELKVQVDKGPLLDAAHLIKVPFLPHAVTGFLALPISDIANYLPSMRKK